MDPVSIVVAAFAAGAAAGVKDTAAEAIKDAYFGLKHLISQRYPDVSTSGLERRPDSKAQQSALAESLTDAGAGEDNDVLAAATALVEAIVAHDRTVYATVGVDLSRVEAGSLEFHDLLAVRDATAFRASDVKVAGAINVSGIGAAAKTDHP